MPIRPHSISELAQFAKDDSSPSSRGIKDWLRVADTLRKQGYQAIDNGDIQGAFLFLARSATYILEKIPHHPSYHDLNPTQMGNLKSNGHDILHSLEQLKPRLADKYEQWLARDPKNAGAPSELQNYYGTSISPVVVSRAKRQDSGRDGPSTARVAVSSDQPVRPNVSVDSISHALNGMRVTTSPQERRPPAAPLGGRQWQEEDPTREEVRRQWEREQEMERRRREEPRNQINDRKTAALEAAQRAAGYLPPTTTRYHENAISAVSSPLSSRSNSGHDALPHHPLQDPALEVLTPRWSQATTPTATRQPLYNHPTPTPLDTSSTKMHIQYPQLMSAHQRAQGYQPSVLFPSPERNRTGGSTHLYEISLPQQSSHVPYNQGRSGGIVAQPQYSPAPPPAIPAPQAGSDYHAHYSTDHRVQSHSPRNLRPLPSQPSHQHQQHQHQHQHQSQATSHPPQSKEQKHASSMQSPHPLGLRPIDMPVELLDQFLGVARLNTLRKIETCGLLLGKERGRGFSISTLLIPEQRGTQDTCMMEGEELVVEFSTGRDLITLGWIHTHPTQSCFMSSLDLHTHAAYQSTLKEAISIVCAPTSDPKFGIFRLTDPPGLDIVMNCRAKETFHPHPDQAIYTDCDGAHVRLVSGMHLEIVDLRRGQDFSSSEGTRDI